MARWVMQRQASWRYIASVLSVVTLMSFGFTSSVSAAPQVQICSVQSPNDCMNRSGGGTGNGTNVITYHQNDPHNDFTFAQLFNYVCGKYPYVRNGENGCVGPFTNGSGLNARYDGDPVVELWAYNEGKCVAIPNFTTTYTALEPCGAPGYVFVQSRVNGAYYLISVGESNYVYGLESQSNNPQWLDDYGPSPMEVSSQASNSWGCVGGGLGNC